MALIELRLSRLRSPFLSSVVRCRLPNPRSSVARRYTSCRLQGWPWSAFGPSRCIPLQRFCSFDPWSERNPLGGVADSWNCLRQRLRRFSIQGWSPRFDSLAGSTASEFSRSVSETRGSGYSGGVRKEYSACRERSATKLGMWGWHTGWASACVVVWMGSRRKLHFCRGGSGERLKHNAFRGYGGVGSRLRCSLLKSLFSPSPTRKRATRSRS